METETRRSSKQIWWYLTIQAHHISVRSVVCFCNIVIEFYISEPKLDLSGTRLFAVKLTKTRLTGVEPKLQSFQHSSLVYGNTRIMNWLV